MLPSRAGQGAGVGASPRALPGAAVAATSSTPHTLGSLNTPPWHSEAAVPPSATELVGAVLQQEEFAAAGSVTGALMTAPTWQGAMESAAAEAAAAPSQYNTAAAEAAGRWRASNPHPSPILGHYPIPNPNPNPNPDPNPHPHPHPHPHPNPSPAGDQNFVSVDDLASELRKHHDSPLVRVRERVRVRMRVRVRDDLAPEIRKQHLVCSPPPPTLALTLALTVTLAFTLALALSLA